MLANLVNELEVREQKARDNEPPEVKAKRKADAAEQKAARRVAEAEAAREAKRLKRNDADDRDNDDVDFGDEDEDMPDTKFSFISPDERMDAKDMKFYIDRVLRRGSIKRNSILLRALYRGIGVHHDSLHVTYRQLVETLFRGKHLKFVITTETLSMGINMPCKSVCFAGDYRLTPLLYQQMSGRAGRRGFDDVGHVIFFGVPPRKAFRLIKAKLSHLSGYYTVTANLVLRMILQHNGVSNKDASTSAFRALLERPFCTGNDVQKNALIQQSRVHFRFLLHYFHTKGLIDSKGNCKGMANLINHLHSETSAVFPFATLLENGFFSNLCRDFTQDNAGVALKVVSVLAHFFNRIPMSAGSNPLDLREDGDTVSKVVLPPLPKEAQIIVEEHNRLTLNCYSDFMRIFHRHHRAKDPAYAQLERVLPLSRIVFPPRLIRQAAETAPGTVADSIFRCARPEASVRSPFASLSGNMDAFGSLEELSDASGDPFAPHVEPISVPRDLMFNEVKLNAYASDIFTHRNVRLLIASNHLSDSVAFTALKSWVTTLDQLREDIEKASNVLSLPERDQSPVYLCFKYIEGVFRTLYGNFQTMGFQSSANE